MHPMPRARKAHVTDWLSYVQSSRSSARAPGSASRRRWGCSRRPRRGTARGTTSWRLPRPWAPSRCLPSWLLHCPKRWVGARRRDMYIFCGRTHCAAVHGWFIDEVTSAAAMKWLYKCALRSQPDRSGSFHWTQIGAWPGPSTAGFTMLPMHDMYSGSGSGGAAGGVGGGSPRTNAKGERLADPAEVKVLPSHIIPDNHRLPLPQPGSLHIEMLHVLSQPPRSLLI
jgi:hypothetical protein